MRASQRSNLHLPNILHSKFSGDKFTSLNKICESPQNIEECEASEAAENMAEDMELMEKRHKQELRELEGKVRALLKTAKKSNKAVIEAEAIQMGFDLKARHREELDNIPDLEGFSHDDAIHYICH